jgi:outer membrane receptor for ferrienterochelin and colicin
MRRVRYGGGAAGPVVLAGIILLLLPWATVRAQSKPGGQITADDIFALVDGTLSTVTKTERPLKTAPLAVTIITRQQLDAIGAVTIADALRLVPGVNTRWSPMGPVFGIRSLGTTPFASRVLVLVDGAPYNSPDKGGLSGHPAYEDFFPIEQVKRIEVVKGPGSALYGQNAYQGVINIITLSGDDVAGTEIEIAGGARDTAQARLTYGGKRGDLTYAFTGKFKRQEGPMAFQRNSTFENGDGYVKAAYKGFGLAYLLHGDSFGSFDTGRTPVPTIPTGQTLHLLVASHETKINPAWRSTLKVLYNRRDGNTCANCHDPTGGGTIINGLPATPQQIEQEHETSQRYWINHQMNWSPAESLHRVVFGGEYQHDRSTKNISKRLDSEPNTSTAGVFAQDEMSFLDKRLIATVGGRLDHHGLSGTAFSPSASLVYLPVEKLVLRGAVGRAFRQPTWNDLFINHRFRPAVGATGEARRVGNPDLKPEHITTVEAGAEYFLSGASSIKLDAFYSSIGDYIEGESFTLGVGGPGQPPRPDYIGPGGRAMLALAANRTTTIRTSGGEIELRLKPFTSLSGIVSYAYQTHNLDERVDAQAAYIPKHKVTAMATFTPITRLSINFDMNTVSRFNSASPGLTLGLSTFAPGGILFGDRVGEPYAIANANVQYRIVSRATSSVGLTFEVRNLFNEKVQQTPVGAVDVSLRGREPFVKVYYKF